MLALRFLGLSIVPLLLAACVDTTGLSGQSSRPPKGRPDAVITVAEYADLQCPACKAAHETVAKPLLTKYGQQIRFEFWHFPITSLHRYALEAAQAAECAADQGKFWEFVDVDYANQKDLSSAQLRNWAISLGLDTDLFERCRKSGIKKKTVLADYEAGRKAGVNGTPAFFVGDKRVESTLEAISSEIDTILQGGGVPL